MRVFLLPEFVNDLQSHRAPHFARQVLKHTLCKNGIFRSDRSDHPYKGVQNAFIRVVSRGTSGYRVIYLRCGKNIYLYRAGEHSIEDRITPPSEESVKFALSVGEAEEGLFPAVARRQAPTIITEPTHRFLRNAPEPQIQREIFSRRNLPHESIWLVSPFINENLLLPTAKLGKLLLEQHEDGATVGIITTATKNMNIKWMERLNKDGIEIFVYPQLHTKLYYFLFDESRRYTLGLRASDRHSSLILMGSANLTSAGIALTSVRGDKEMAHCNEELCCAIPESGISYITQYVNELKSHGYDLQSVRQFLARGQGHKLEKKKWQ